MTAQTTPTYLSNLTPLRGIAALLTVIFHVDLMLGSGGDMLLKFSDSMFINRLHLMGRVAVVVGRFVGYASITLLIRPLVTFPATLPFFTYNPTDNSANLGFLRCMFGFVLGMIMYLGYRDGWGKSWLANGYTPLLPTLGLGLCMHFAIPDVFTLGFLPLLILSATYGSQRINARFGKSTTRSLSARCESAGNPINE